MHPRTLIVAAVMTGAWAGACSKPASENSTTTNSAAKQGSPELLLVDRAGPDAPLVSDLEVGRDPKMALIGPADRKALEPRPARRTAATTAGAGAAGAPHTHNALPAADLVPEMGQTSTSLAAAPQSLPQATLPAAPAAGDAYGSGGDGLAPLPAEGNRGPVIIIRGGRGGVLDDCAIHGRGGHGGPGIAINRSVPAFGGGGGTMVNERAPRLGGGGSRSGFPRSGIR